MIKLVDQLSAMGSFPIATAQDIVCSDNERLQEKIDNGTLGGGGGSTATTLTQEEYDALDPQEQLEGEFYCYDSARHFRNGVEYGKAVDISSKQDNLSQVKFTMRRNSASEGRYCLIGSSDLSQNLLMCEPYRFQGIFGDGTTSVENKSIIDFMVSFREGVENPDEVLSGFANSSKGFDFVDLLITADETTNMAYAYVDFKVAGAVATGEITKPVLEAESYMDFAESFELVDTYQGTLICKMSDYCKVITEIDDETASENSVYSSAKVDKKFMLTVRDSAVGIGMTKNGIHTIQEFFTFLIDKYGKKGCMDVQWSDANSAYVKYESTIVGINGGMLIWDGTDVTPDSTGAYQTMTALYIPHKRNVYSVSDNYNGVYKIYCVVASTVGVVANQGIEIIGNIDDSSTSTTSTYSSSKIDTELAKKLSKNYNLSLTDANTAIDSGGGLYIYRVGSGCLNIPVNRIGIIISNNYSDTQYKRITQTYMTNDDDAVNGLIYMRYGMSNNSGSTYTWSDWKQISYLDDSSTSETSTWSSSKIAQQDGVKSVFYASATAYPSIIWVLSDVTTGVFWFKHTLSDSAGVKSVEGYADLTHDTVRLISGSDINVGVGTDTTSGKKGVRFIVAWGDSTTTSCKITEARPVTAIPTQIVSR